MIVCRGLCHEWLVIVCRGLCHEWLVLPSYFQIRFRSEMLLVTSLNRPLGSVGEILGRRDTHLTSLPLF